MHVPEMKQTPSVGLEECLSVAADGDKHSQSVYRSMDIHANQKGPLDQERALVGGEWQPDKVGDINSVTESMQGKLTSRDKSADDFDFFAGKGSSSLSEILRFRTTFLPFCVDTLDDGPTRGEAVTV